MRGVNHTPTGGWVKQLLVETVETLSGEVGGHTLFCLHFLDLPDLLIQGDTDKRKMDV